MHQRLCNIYYEYIIGSGVWSAHDAFDKENRLLTTATNINYEESMDAMHL